MEIEDTNPFKKPAVGLSWAVYLGVSWTWCIGMFLPVLIMRDYGIAGWLVVCDSQCHRGGGDGVGFEKGWVE